MRPSAMVAPHAGAWIETDRGHQVERGQEPRPTRARGLKRWVRAVHHRYLRSRPTRARGLKPVYGQVIGVAARVAPHAGAWIETSIPSATRASTPSRAPRGRVDLLVVT